MHRKTTLVLALSLVFIGFTYFNWNYFFNDNVAASGAYKKLPKMDRIDLAMEQEWWITHDRSLGTIPKERLMEAARIRDERLAALGNNRAVAGLAWLERGPSNVGGRTRALLYDVNDAANGYKKVWAGSVSGGLWYTNDITVSVPNWHRVNDFLGNLAITTIAQNPANTQEIYVGTGEGWFNVDQVRGLGIWKSSDGGRTWAQLGSTNNSSFFFVQKIVVTSGGIVLATTHDGVQRSINGGTSWTKVLGAGVGGGTVNRSADLEIATNGNVFASLGIFNLDGIYRSVDNGLNWTKIYTSVGDENRIELACAPNDAEYVYALVHGRNGIDGISGNGDDDGIKKVMRTTNGSSGAPPTWNNLTIPSFCDSGPSNPDFTRNQAWYDLIALVDPANRDIVYVGGIDVHKTTNGGTSWTQTSQWSTGCAIGVYVHADIHGLVMKPGSSSEFLVGCDGGIYRSTDAGANYAHRNHGYNVTQFYASANHPTDPNYFLAGAQDNGSQKFSVAGLNSTIQASGGDGAFAHIDQDAPLNQITAYVFNNYFVSTNGGTSFSSVNIANTGQFINPTDYANTENILYAGHSAGDYLRWTNPTTVGPTSTVSCAAFAGASIVSVTVSPNVANRVYFGLDNGTVVRVDNAHLAGPATGTVIFTGTGSITCLEIQTGSDDHMLLTFGDYGNTSVLETTNGTAVTPTWNSVEGDLPDMPVRWALFDPRNSDWALIATELGVWSTDNLNPGGTTNWNPTNASLANSRVDMIQYASATRVLSAATHGRGLFTATVPTTTTEAIRFSRATQSTSEQLAVTTGCRSYKDYTINMVTEAPITTSSVINVAIAGGATATQGVDYDFTTNGSFSSPSASITFGAGTTDAHDIIVRVYDDSIVEASESFTLNYSIASGSAVTGSSNQTCAFTITDNDKVPTGPTVVSAGIGLNNVGLTQPFRGGFEDSRTQMLYTAAELDAAGFRKGSVTEVRFNVTSKGSSAPYNNFTIKMKNTTNDSLRAGNVFESGLTTVHGPISYSTVAGVNTIVLASPFAWDGTSNLLVDICFDNAAVTANDVVAATNGMARLLFERGNTAAGCSYTKGNFLFAGNPRPDIGLSITNTPTPVESVLNSNRFVYLGANADIYLYSQTDGELLARVRNLSTHDYGCTEVLIDRAGTSAVQFWNTNPAEYLMSKTFDMNPTTPNPTGNIEVTLYFTPAEVNGWQTATGQVWANIQAVKVQSEISDVTPGNPSGGGTVEVLAPTLGTLGTNFTLTRTFATGLGGFGAGIPGAAALPVTLLDFRGRLQNSNVLLEWSTVHEQNSKGFDIEKSFDGTTYNKIGFVQSGGNSSTLRRYSFLDRQKAVEFNYYRLKMVDLDNSFKYSDIVLVKNPATGQEIFVMNNPFVNELSIRFAKIPKGKIGVQLYDMNGKKIYEAQYDQPVQNIVPIYTGSKYMSSGTYILKVETEGKTYSMKVVKR